MKFETQKTSYKGKGNPFYGKKHTGKTILEIKTKAIQRFKNQEYLKRYVGKNNPFYGKHHSNITKKNMSKFRKGKISYIPNEMTKKKISETWKQKYKKGVINPMKGKERPDFKLRRKDLFFEKKRLKNFKESPNTTVNSLKLKQEFSKRMRENNPTKGKENHTNWKGGISFEPYSIEFDNKLKEKIRKRDNYTCQECKEIQPPGHNFAIHHIDYNKKNSVETNLITLCRSCHSQTNYRREDWQKYFQDKIRGEPFANST